MFGTIMDTLTLFHFPARRSPRICRTVCWDSRVCWGNPGPFDREVMPLDEALTFVATEGFFWIHGIHAS